MTGWVGRSGRSRNDFVGAVHLQKKERLRNVVAHYDLGRTPPASEVRRLAACTRGFVDARETRVACNEVAVTIYAQSSVAGSRAVLRRIAHLTLLTG
jgi:hypothetical protein